MWNEKKEEKNVKFFCLRLMVLLVVYGQSDHTATQLASNVLISKRTPPFSPVASKSNWSEKLLCYESTGWMLWLEERLEVRLQERWGQLWGMYRVLGHHSPCCTVELGLDDNLKSSKGGMHDIRTCRDVVTKQQPTSARTHPCGSGLGVKAVAK